MLGLLKRLARGGPATRTLRVISATRRSEEAFWAESALGQSLAAHGSDTVVDVAFDNRAGLPAVYNAGLARCRSGERVLFVHDDVWLDDADWRSRIEQGLQAYDVIGVAGNRRRLPGQPGWSFLGRNEHGKYLIDVTQLSGAIREGREAHGELTQFGPAPADCELLDGVLLAADVDALRRGGVSFDERFAFHFYDLDFCRTARAAGLRLGTWPIGLTHQSEGAFKSGAWEEGLAAYFDKWGD
jgi:GT2 family glycosyltransferase